MNEDHENVISPDIRDSVIGAVAGTIHHSNIYVTAPNASREELFNDALQAIDGGRFDLAREWIEQAIGRGYKSPEVRFYWVISMLSGRSQRDLNADDRRELHHLRGLLPTLPADEWKQALELVLELVGSSQPKADTTTDWRTRIESLPTDQQRLINDHLDQVVPGAIKVAVWKKRREAAIADQFSNGRLRRIGLFFEADPIAPRTQEPHPFDAVAARAALPVRTALFTVATLAFATIALMTDPLVALAEISIGVVAGLSSARFGIRWADQVWALKPSPTHRLPAYTVDKLGFSKDVRQAFQRHYASQLPPGISQGEWLATTDDERARLSHEIAHLYRESRTTIEQVDWLIKHLAVRASTNSSVAASADLDPRSSSIWPKVLTMTSSTSLAIAIAAALITIFSHLNPSRIGLCVIAAGVAIWAGHAAASAALEVRGERRRVAREKAEQDQEARIRLEAYKRWKYELDTTRPREQEMERWLNSDKTLFLTDVLANYDLGWDNLITYTFLVTPASGSRRSRVNRGPWRYSRYSFRLFLVTLDGVREVSTNIDILTAKRGTEERSSYRFDALSSVQVTEDNRHRYDLRLTLTNGPSRQILIKDGDTQRILTDPDDEDFADEGELSKASLDATHFTQTFRLLEGIAADGKQWAKRQSAQTPSSTASST